MVKTYRDWVKEWRQQIDVVNSLRPGADATPKTMQAYENARAKLDKLSGQCIAAKKREEASAKHDLPKPQTES